MSYCAFHGVPSALTRMMRERLRQEDNGGFAGPVACVTSTYPAN